MKQNNIFIPGVDELQPIGSMRPTALFSVARVSL